MSIWAHVRAILLLPVMVTIVVPAVLLWRGGVDTFDIWSRARWTRVALPVAGGVLIAAGLWLFVVTLWTFVTIGRGTLAPWNPTQRLVVTGVYRYVRNPMITGVCLILLGEVLMAASLPLAGWGACFVLVNALYTPLIEEPGLVRRFGAEYEEYRRHVPRWLPRCSPWTSSSANGFSKMGK
jgi:protein-S-isoprenylcysteine O-methyltransferase Ste14